MPTAVVSTCTTDIGPEGYRKEHQQNNEQVAAIEGGGIECKTMTSNPSVEQTHTR